MEPSLEYSKVGRVRRGWELTKSSWRVLTLDKELMLLPVLGFIVNVVVFIALAAAMVAIIFGLLSLGVSVFSIQAVHGVHGTSYTGSNNGLPFLIFFVLLYLLLTIVGNYFSGAIVYGAAERFRGGDPTVRSSLAGVGRRFGSLAAFSLLSATVGLVLQALQDRLPFAGKILAILGGVAWNIATIFAVPIIVLGDTELGPIDTTKQSVQMVRKVWGEGLIVQAGIGIISVLSFFGFIALALVVGWFAAAFHAPTTVAVGLVLVGLLAFAGMTIVFGTLASIAKAALYHYATTGEAPELFNKDLLHASMSVKKARRVFS